MSRSQRLLALLELLRQYRYPIKGQLLADKLNISLRTLYRDIASLQAQGADIVGEPGLGYVLRPGFMLPPMMFSEEEIEALVLGSRWVARKADTNLKRAATQVLAKISAILPSHLRHQLESSGLLIGPAQTNPIKEDYEALIRYAMRKEYKVQLCYADAKEETSQRLIWPLALGFFEETRVIVAWCELRQDFRHFRTDRIIQLSLTDTPFKQRRAVLLKRWRDRYHIPEQ
ncbi:transcription regulator protein, DeoR family [Legionella beliardensis]|uniref:Transcription regulator protein, DeoR family n=1 Tax=Legionella beliardensis TaxID=91822 RepID=A0A378I1A2_9GAMM|nr:YafY family protein [Legionella beliardensis]STX28511.1 transcription regulator protein, DeoR family [Legionella beliardensis]